MSKNDWYEAGDQIKKLVQDAVDSGDFSQLGSTISNVVNDTVDGLQAALRENLGANTQRQRQERAGGSGETWQAGRSGRTDTMRDDTYRSTAWDDGMQKSSGMQRNSRSQDLSSRVTEFARAAREEVRRNADEYTNRQAAERIRRRMEEKRQYPEVKGKDRTYKPVKAKIRVPGEISGMVMKVIGYTMGSMIGLAAGIVFIVAISEGDSDLLLPFFLLAFLFGISYGVGRRGNKKHRLAVQFKRFREIMGERTYCLVEELASAVGESVKSVRKDLKKMIRKGYFREGYLDQKGTLLITDRETYQQYLGAQTEYARRELGEQARQNAQQEQARQNAQQERESRKEQPKEERSPECRELIAEGERYIRHIHECNERIPGEEMSAKLERLELVITKIFRKAEREPSLVSDLKKMMSYYLPTTSKLLDAYIEMEDQPIKGQNIEKTKREIENALDTINAAFENLLDSFFEEKSWDISSDISVLNTMFAQEGLTGTDFAAGNTTINKK